MNSLARAEATTDRTPTPGQVSAGNYRKGKYRIHGVVVSIENPRGSTRSAKDGSWSVRMPCAYGYILGTEGADGDHLDCFVGPHPKSPSVYVLDQHDVYSAGDFDELKCFIGFSSEKQVRNFYHRSFSDGRGNDRIGHIKSFTVRAFKDWLRDGDAKTPLRRASGGRAYADGGGVPAFDPSKESSEIPPYREDAGGLDAFARGAAQGATFNLGDEIAGAHEIGPRMPSVGPVPGAVLRTGIGAAKSFLGSDEEKARYEKRRDEVREGNEAAKKNRPWTYGGGELAGAIPAMAAVPEAGAVRALAPGVSKMAKFGAGMIDSATQGGIYGGISGAGEGTSLGDRAIKGAQGIVSGIIGGGLAKGAEGVASAAYNKFGAPIVNTMRGWWNQEGEAARRVAAALKADNDLIVAGKANGLTPQQWIAAKRAGEPVTLADLGSANTQSLLRSAANTSPEARAQLEKVIEGRFLNQSERVADTVRGALPGGQANARKTADQMVADYDIARVPAYKRSYQEGDRPIMTPAMERLMSSDTFVAAMKRAISSGKDRDIAHGYGGFNPQVSVNQSGSIVFNKGAQGIPTYPNLQYWDAVKKELDGVASVARRQGDTSSTAGDLAKLLRSELDSQVPSYKKARGIAEDFFGEKNALEAGRALAGKKPVAAEVEGILRKMDPRERELFREGYASDLAERVIGRMKDTQNITKSMFNSPNERQLAAVIFGPGGMAQLRARMALETIMNGARDAMGNSTTARQLIEAGLAGGAVSGYSSGWDPMAMVQGAGGFAAARGAPNFLAPQAVQGVKHLVGKVDAKTAARVAELLTSDNPRLLQEGLKKAAGDERISRALMATANKLFMSSQAQAREPVSSFMTKMQGAIPGRADEQQDQQRP